MADKKSPFKPTGRRLMRQDLVSQLLVAIFSGHFKGGDRLVEHDLAVQFGVSRTPVREALNQLAATGLIETLPNRGAVVKPFGPKQLRDFYELRQVLEGYATKLAHRNINREELAEVHKATAGLLKQRGRGPAWSRRAMDVDERLHEMISTASGNDRLREEINRYRKLMRVVRATIANEAGYQEQAIAQHLKILDALLNNLPDEAAQLMHEHIGDAAEAALAVVFASAKEASMATDEPSRSRSTR